MLEAAAVLAGGLGSRLAPRDAPWTFHWSHDHQIPMIIVAALVAWLDLVSRDEMPMLANLGLAPRLLVGCYLVPVVLLEAFFLTLR